jgi:DNA polymerase
VQALADGVPEEQAPAPVVVASAVSVPAAAAVAPVPPSSAPPVPPSAAVVSDAEDTAWFDEAPVPAPAPRPAPQPARPAPQPAPPAPRAAAPADADPVAEDTAWFDDAPMPPAAAPSRPVAEVLPEVRSDALPDAQSEAPVSDAAIAAMDWPALQAAVSSCTRCTLCETRVAAVNGRGAQNASWIAIAAAPSAADEQDVQAITGEAGQLLHNMLKAIELKPDTDVYITNVVKCRPPGRNPTAEEVIACRPYLERELALTGATMAMTFGQFAARGMMMGPAARGKVMHYGASRLPVVATYHPDDLLRKPEEKAKAWADLCLAKASHG